METAGHLYQSDITEKRKICSACCCNLPKSKSLKNGGTGTECSKGRLLVSERFRMATKVGYLRENDLKYKSLQDISAKGIFKELACPCY